MSSRAASRKVTAQLETGQQETIDHSRQLLFATAMEPLSAGQLLAKAQQLTAGGYQVVWILDDSWANGRQLLLAEALAMRWACYFRDAASGAIYDQLQITVDRQRRCKSAPYRVDLRQWQQVSALPSTLCCLRCRPQFAFAGDVRARLAAGTIRAATLRQWERAEARLHRQRWPWRQLPALLIACIEHLL